ncbi:hypothetical protein [Nonomuraea dietziae]
MGDARLHRSGVHASMTDPSGSLFLKAPGSGQDVTAPSAPSACG